MPHIVKDRIALKEKRAEKVKRILKQIPSKVKPLHLLTVNALAIDFELSPIGPIGLYLPKMVAIMAKKIDYRIASYYEPQSSKDCSVATTIVTKTEVKE